MTVEYIVLGVLLILMGLAQTWLRHGPGAKKLRDDQQTGQRRSSGVRSGRAWEAWTAILGGVGVALGIVLVVLGALGR